MNPQVVVAVQLRPVHSVVMPVPMPHPAPPVYDDLLQTCINISTIANIFDFYLTS